MQDIEATYVRPLSHYSKQKLQKRKTLNESALLTSSNDVLNSTAPLNLKQIPKFYNNEDTACVIQGFSDVVNSTSNLQRMSSKES